MSRYHLPFILLLVVLCGAHSLRTSRINCLRPNALTTKLKGHTRESSIDFKKVASSLATFFILSSTAPIIASANPEAIDVRRVSEEDAPRSDQRKTVTSPSGVEYYDAVIGDGPEATEGKSVQFQWVLRRSNGYFVDASSNYGDEPFIYKVGNTKKAIKGIDEAIRGMRVGGVRRINIPPSMAFIEGVGDDKPGPMPQGFGPRRQILTRIDKEVWYFEIKLLKAK